MTHKVSSLSFELVVGERSFCSSSFSMVLFSEPRIAQAATKRNLTTYLGFSSENVQFTFYVEAIDSMEWF